MGTRTMRQPARAVPLPRWDWTYPHRRESTPVGSKPHFPSTPVKEVPRLGANEPVLDVGAEWPLKSTLGGHCPLHPPLLHALAEQPCRQNNVRCTLLLLPGSSWTNWVPRFAFMFECYLLHNIKQCHHLKSLIRWPGTFKFFHYPIWKKVWPTWNILF